MVNSSFSETRIVPLYHKKVWVHHTSYFIPVLRGCEGLHEEKQVSAYSGKTEWHFGLGPSGFKTMPSSMLEWMALCQINPVCNLESLVVMTPTERAEGNHVLESLSTILCCVPVVPIPVPGGPVHCHSCLVVSQLDYCIVVDLWLPLNSIRKLQLMQNVRQLYVPLE